MAHTVGAGPRRTLAEQCGTPSPRLLPSPTRPPLRSPPRHCHCRAAPAAAARRSSRVLLQCKCAARPPRHPRPPPPPPRRSAAVGGQSVSQSAWHHAPCSARGKTHRSAAAPRGRAPTPPPHRFSRKKEVATGSGAERRGGARRPWV